jgi:tRNA G18 (ribose-2'-O)-methylase SpoU
MYSIKTHITAFNQDHNAIDNAKKKEIKVQIYGINSINQAIIASVNIQSIFIQNNFNTNNHISVIKNILTAKINCHFIHSDNVFVTLISLLKKYSDSFLGNIE